MVTDASTQADTPATDPHISALQSKYDGLLSQMDTRLKEESTLNDELARELDEQRAQVQQLLAKGYENDDPEVAGLRKELAARTKALSDMSRQHKQAMTVLKSELIRAEAAGVVLTAAQRGQVDKYAEMLQVGRSAPEIRAQAAKLRDAGIDIPAPTTRPGDEVDAGRSGGRGGTPRITRAVLAEHLGDPDGGRAWRKENATAINAALADAGGSLPER